MGALLVPVVLLALAVRVVGVVADLPDMYNTDEVTNLRIVDRMVVEGDPNPGFFNYPSLFFYLHAAAHLDGPLLSWVPQLPEAAPAALTLGTAHTSTPTSVLVHRGLTVALGVLVVVLAALTAWRTCGSRVAVAVTALLLATSPTAVINSRPVTPDMLAAAAVAGAHYAAVRVLQQPSWGRCAAAGATVGIAAGAKYNAALVAVSLAVAVLSTSRTLRWRTGGLVVAGAASVLVFVATTPFAVLDQASFLRDLRFEMDHYAEGHAGMEGDSLVYYASHLLTQETAVTALLVSGAAWALGRRLATAGLARPRSETARRSEWLTLVTIGIFPLLYVAQVSTYEVRNARTLLLALPALAVLAGCLVAGAVGGRPRGLDPRLDQWRAGLVTATGSALLGLSLATTLADSSWPLRATTRDAAQAWFAAEVPPGSRLVLEGYSPWLDPERYEIDARIRAVDGAWPDASHADLVVLSEQMYGRYLRESSPYPEVEAAYARLLATSRPVATFTGNGPTIRVLRTVEVAT